MTFDEIIQKALIHLEYGEDTETLHLYFPKFIVYANQAVQLIAKDIKPVRKQTVALQADGEFSLSCLAKPCTKVVEIKDASGRALRFEGGSEADCIKPIGASSQTVEVRYRYLPHYRSEPNAVPDIPLPFHSIIPLYIVHMHYNTGAGHSDIDRTKWLQMFMSAKASLLKQGYGATPTYEFKNLPWD